MPRTCYRQKSFRPKSEAMITQANLIVQEYQAAGLRLTLRQLYYQYVSRALLPNTERSYKNLASLISDARLAGRIDWSAIEDRGREPIIPPEWDDIPSLVESALRAFRLPRWEGQERYVELWVEKQALAGVLAPLAREFHATLMINKGYSSQSAMYESAQRFLERGEDAGRKPVLLYLGDHDPSGEDMVRDIEDRLVLFGVDDIVVEKVALTMKQIRQFNPPPNPAKVTDPRAANYIATHGESSWEVDALDPKTLAKLIRAAFRKHVDEERMEEVVEREASHKEQLRELVAGATWR